MKAALALALSLACFSTHATDYTVAPDNQRLMRALENLAPRVVPKSDGLVVARGARYAGQAALGAAGLALIASYAAHWVPLEIVHRALVKHIRWAAIGGSAAVAASVGVNFGGHLYNAVMEDLYRQYAVADRSIYQSQKGLAYFFQLPIDEQFLYARQNPEFADFLVSTSDAFDLLSGGFDRPNRPAAPLPR